MGIAAIISIITTVVSDAPTLLSIVEKVIPIIKDDRAPTSEEWSDIVTSITSAHDKLQAADSSVKSAS